MGFKSEVKGLDLHGKITINVRVDTYKVHRFFDKIMRTFRKDTLYPNLGLK